MIRTVIVDDEPKNVSILRHILTEYCPEVSIIGEAGDVKSATEFIRKNEPELVFLDIEMPYGNGFDILNNLSPVHFEVIFTTAFDKYMLKAFRYAALDYLLKPINIEELKTAVHRAEQKISQANTASRINLLLENFKNKNFELQKIAIPTTEGFRFVPIGDISHCEAKGGYTVIHLRGGEKTMVSRNIKEYEDLLPETVFFRIHNSHIINLNYVKKYHRGRGGYIELEDGTTLELAIRRKDEFFKRFGLS